MLPKKSEIVYEFRYDGFDKDWQEERLREIGNTYTCLSGKSAQDSGNGQAAYVINIMYTNT